MAKLKKTKFKYYCIFSFIIINIYSCYKSTKIPPYKPKYFDVKLDPTRNSIQDSLKHLLPLLDSVYYNDIKYRTIILGDSKSFIAMEYAMKNNIFEVKKLDSINQKIVDSLLTKYGWLSPKKISITGYTAIFCTIQHSNIKFQLKYEKMLENAMKKNEILNINYSMFKDRLLMYQHFKQIFGTQIVYSKL